MISKLSKLSNLFYFLFFIPIAVGLTFIVFDFETNNVFSFDVYTVKLMTLAINSVGILSIKLIEKYFKSIKSDNFGFDKKFNIYKAKMLSGISIIYLIEIINILSYLSTGDRIIIIIYFLMVLLILVYLPTSKKIESM